MSEKIWFIYITDHHEGPFTPEEVKEKFSQGLVNAQTLAWKDGMPEWVALETIPELKAILDSAATAPAEGASADGGEFSLAELMSKTQSGIESPSIAMDSGVIESGAAALASVSSSVSQMSSEPSTNEEVWTMKIGAQVSGLHSLQNLIQLASMGDVPADAMLWHPGWTDFKPVTEVSEVATARKPKKTSTATGGTKTGITGLTNASKTGSIKMGGITRATAVADIGSDDPTDPSIQLKKPNKLLAILDQLKALLKKKPKQKAKSPIGTVGTLSGVSGIGGQIGRRKDSSGAVKRVASILAAVLVVCGLGAVYFLYFSSPIPSSLDVIPDDLDVMRELIAQPVSQGKKYHLAMSRGTEDNPADDTNPKLYVATNLPEGTQVKLTLIGVPGTIVNKLNFEKTYTATVAKTHIATFEQLSGDGKPLPLGEYQLFIESDGTDKIEIKRFLGGKKGGVYDRRLKQYKEKLQADYDKELEELRQYIGTLRSVYSDMAKKAAEIKAAAPNQKQRVVNEWKSLYPSLQGTVYNMDTKVKQRISSTEPQKFYPRAYQDISTTLTQITQLGQTITSKMDGGAVNPDELEGLVQAGILSLEQWMVQAVTRSPFDALKANEVPALSTPKPAAPAPTAAPAPVR